MSFLTTVLVALRLRAGEFVILPEPTLAYRAIVDSDVFHRSQVDALVTWRARVDAERSHRVQVEAL